MTCTRYEKVLALHVEQDLPHAEIPALEAHLRECESCRGFLGDLESSQGLVRDLAAEPMSSEALVVLRARASSAFEQRAEGPRAARGWALAAAVVVAIGVLSWRTMRSPITVPGPQAAAPSSSSPDRTPAATPAPELAYVEKGESHPAPRRSRVGGKQPEGLASLHPATAPPLSVEDADQLARAVVAVSRIQRLSDPAREPLPMASPGLLIRLTTADPNVAIYWRLDSNGGQ